jgi:aminoglycoside phosphotransferase (APT) family kinase protein
MEPGLDPSALRGWFSSALPAGAGYAGGALSARRLAGGRSNLTYLVTETGGEGAGTEGGDAGPSWVLRRPPLGHVLATAHDMAREYRVLRALAGTGVPVPEVLALCEDTEVIGAPFYVMEYVRGVVYRTHPMLAEVAASGHAPAIAHRLTDILATLHTVDPATVGLADFGRPAGFLDRQLRRWARQLEASRSRDVPGFAALAEALAAGVPTSPRPALVHGDYRLDNVLVAPPDQIVAVLDWEMATLGDPLADLGMFCMYWDGWADLTSAPVAPSPAAHAGFPSRGELVERYATRSGVPVGSLDWYVGFAFYKISVILEGIYFRHVQGLTVGEGFDHLGDLVPTLVERGRAALASPS